MSIIPALGRLRQEDLEFKTSQDYIMRPCLKVSLMPIILATWEAEIRRIVV
jgi:hypothetical protein